MCLRTSQTLRPTLRERWTRCIRGYQTQHLDFKWDRILELGEVSRWTHQKSPQQVHKSMVQSINLVLVDYLSQCAFLNISATTNLLGSVKYRTRAISHIFATLKACFARRIYEWATAAVRCLRDARVAISTTTFKDTFKLGYCWKGSGYSTICIPMIGYCGWNLSPIPWTLCYEDHRKKVQKQNVAFGTWFAPMPIYLVATYRADARCAREMLGDAWSTPVSLIDWALGGSVENFPKSMNYSIRGSGCHVVFVSVRDQAQRHPQVMLRRRCSKGEHQRG